jgi:S-adenosylmethionine:tRNA ribosyltransferase-isomerase
VHPGERLVASLDRRVFADVGAVASASPRMVDVRFRTLTSDAPAATWAALYRVGKPVQYAHVPARLALWDVQNVYASRPWAVEMPSAGRTLRAETILALRGRGIGVARVTHAAGLSSTGDPAIDALLPLTERYHVPTQTAAAVNTARRRGGRIVAVGTSVVRALESASRSGTVAAGGGVTDLRLGPGVRRRVVDALLTGVHEEGTSHFALLGAFASARRLDDLTDVTARERLLGHEFGDAWLVWGDEAEALACACLRSATVPAA